MTGQKETWLACRNGKAVCLICEADPAAKEASPFGKGTASLLWKHNMGCHAKSDAHKCAARAWQTRLEAEAEGEDPAAAVPTELTNARAVIAARALLETHGSFRSFDTLRDAFVGDEREALESRAGCISLVATMAQCEKELTH